MKNRLHIVRYGTNAEQKYFNMDFNDCFNCIAINANMIAFSPNALSIFIGKKAVDKNFFIDPITHAFQHDQSVISDDTGSVIKKSISNLIKAYSEGNNLLELIAKDNKGVLLTKNSLKVEDLSEDFMLSFCKNVLDYQSKAAENQKIENISSYVDFAVKNNPSLGELQIKRKPIFLVAPYFYLTSYDEQSWLSKNLRLIEIAVAEKGQSLLFAQIVLGRKLLETALLSSSGYKDSELSKIIEKYKKSKADGFLIWIDEFSEHDESAPMLRIYNALLKDLKEAGKKVYSLYGGYYSTILTSSKIKLLDGVAHGLEYGERRDVIPVGGGVPLAKFYFYPVHARLNYSDMIRALIRLNIKTKSDYFKQICSCDTCKEVIINDDVLSGFASYGESKPSTFKRGDSIVTMNFSTTSAKEFSLKHYLVTKKTEFEFVRDADKEQIKQALDDAYNAYKDCFKEKLVRHLIEWKDALSDPNLP